jgi:site-specific DNA recombinase
MQTAARRDDGRLKRLYRSIGDGIVEIDDILREHTATLKFERKRAKAALDRAQCGIGCSEYRRFARLMIDKLDNGDTNARKGYIHSSPTRSRAVRIIGSKDAGNQTANGNVRGVRKWRAIQNKTANSYIIEIAI